MSWDLTGGSTWFEGSFAASYNLPLTIGLFIKYANHTTVDTALAFNATLNDPTDSISIESGPGSDEHRGAARSTIDTFGRGAVTESAGAFDAAWVPIVVVFNSAADRTLYVDTFANSNNNTTSAPTDDLFKHLIVGARDGIGGTQAPWHVAEVFAYDGVMSDADITAFLGGAKATSLAGAANLLAYYSLDSNDTTPDDESAGGLGPTLARTGSGAYAADHPVITGGSTPTIDSVGPDDQDVVYDNELRVEIDGSGFGAVQGAGIVQLQDTASAPTTEVAQTVRTWSDTLIVIDIDLGALVAGANFIAVTPDGGSEGTRSVTVNADPGAAAVARRYSPAVNQALTLGTPFSYASRGHFFAVDVQDELTLSVGGLPAGLAFDGESISGTVALGAAVGSPYNVTVDCDDLDGNSAPQDVFTLTISTASPVVLPLSRVTRFLTQRMTGNYGGF